MLILTANRIALLALDHELAALQASSRAAFFNAIAVTHEPMWPPAPFEPGAFQWAEQHLAHDPEGQGWYGWVLLANEGERAPPRLVGIAALIGRPDEDTGDVELAFGLLPEFRGRGYGSETIRVLASWAFANGAKRVIAHLDAEDASAASTLAKNGFVDTRDPPYPGVARWALSAAA
ncbi:MAG: GNAT family N-acetyltransferase [Hyphomonadaceae bacterium]|nr:GNAT family N-acetyltransferase [Hyphomonadaceae bacterium]MCA8886319.1 GNAT family N-acetyltransferase [Hyphomonadaceae bacterium]